MAAQNALELVRFGRLSKGAYSAPYDVVHGTEHYKLRHYHGLGHGLGHADERAAGIPLILVPPLMVTAEIYDMAADVSAVSALIGQNIDVWVVDFGAPEFQTKGMERTLDDHVRAIDDAIEHVCARAGREVHLAGYSQGGMFAYQVAAYRRTRGLSSLITFGSPVHLHRSLPNVDDAITERLLALLRAVIAVPLERIDGLPGAVTSTAFKLVGARKELSQIADFVRKLHDRQALIKRESRRIFLGGEGFVAWPGPAFRTFVDELIVHNRMFSGGIVIDGRTVALADIRCPILYFVGTRDEIARPAAIRAIGRAAPHAQTHEVALEAGHFGLVVGGTANAITWPTVAEWLRWREGKGARPLALRAASGAGIQDPEDQEQVGDVAVDIKLFYDVIGDAGRALWNRVGDAVKELTGTLHDVRTQVPYINRLRALTPQSRISAGRILAEQARAIPEKTFFVWRDRAFTYGQANRRVDNIVRGLIACGVREQARVGVLMASRPSYLSLLVALNRLGAVAVLLSPDSDADALASALRSVPVSALVCDPGTAARGRDVFAGTVLLLGSGGRGPRGQAAAAATPGQADPPDARVIDMEAIDPDAVELPAWYQPDAARARELASIIFSTGTSGEPRPSYITNLRWAFSALGAAAACTLSPRDTVYCCLPLHHAAGSMVAAGSALVGGGRLALATPFEPETFWSQVRRYGATVVYYAGEMCRALVDAPASAADPDHPVRLFAGSGMRRDVWQRMLDRFGPSIGVLEFYASTEGNAVLANASGEKIGSVGQPIPASADLAVVAYDFAARDISRDPTGRIARCQAGQPGVLLARVDATHPSNLREDPLPLPESRVLRDVFSAGDAWYITGAVVERDRDGDYWFLDRLSDPVLVDGQPVFTRAVEDQLYTVASIALAVVYGARLPGVEQPVLLASVVTRDHRPLMPGALDELAAKALDARMRPRFVRRVADIPMTDGYRPKKSRLREQGLSPDDTDVLYFDRDRGRYLPMDADGYQRALAQLDALSTETRTGSG